MNRFRDHWYDVGGALGVLTLVLLLFLHDGMSGYRLLMGLSLVSLFFHQVEEYRFPGTFPGMLNRVMFRSDRPDRYPLNSNTSLVINTCVGWGCYLLAALLGARAVWLGMATILVSLGNVVAHTFLFNIKGRTLYNAGMATSWLFLAPCVFFFFKIVTEAGLATPADYAVGIPLGLLLNVVGVLKLIGWLAERNTPYIFPQRNLLPRDRGK